MFPDQGAAAGDGIDIEEEQRGFGYSGHPFEVGVGAICLDVVHAEKPGFFGVHQAQLAIAVL